MPSNAGDAGLIPGRGTKIAGALQAKTRKVKQAILQKFSEDFKKKDDMVASDKCASIFCHLGRRCTTSDCRWSLRIFPVRLCVGICWDKAVALLFAAG